MKTRPKAEPSPAPANDAAPAAEAPPAGGKVEAALLAENKQLKEYCTRLQGENARMVARLNAIIFAATAQ